MKGGTYKEWKIGCPCGLETRMWGWTYNMPFPCPSCGSTETEVITGRADKTIFINTDDIPGGIEIRHGICNPDGSPKKYYSKTDIKRAANERGVTILGDTPKPYKVSWSGKKESQ